MKNKIVIGLLLICFPFYSGYAQNIDFTKNDAIDSIVNKYANDYSIVRLSIGIIDNGNKYTNHYGNTDLYNKRQVTDSTMFHVASISKLFTATAIMQLVEKNVLKLDAKLVDILPEFRMKDNRYSKN